MLLQGPRQLGLRFVPLSGRLFGPAGSDTLLLLVAPAPLAQVGQPLGGEGELPVQTRHRHLTLGELPGDLGAMGLGAAPLPGAGVHRRFRRAQCFAESGQLFREEPVTRLRPGYPLGQLFQLVAGQVDTDRELLLHELAVTLGLASLAGQGPDLGLDFAQQIFQPLEVDRGFLQPALGAVLPVAIQTDSRRLLEERTPLLGAIGKEEVDHLGFDHDPGPAAQPGAAQQILDVAKPDRRRVEQVFALAGTGKPPGNHDFPVRNGEITGAVIEVKGNFGETHRSAARRALEDHVFHLAAPKQAGPIARPAPSAPHPTRSICRTHSGRRSR